MTVRTTGAVPLTRRRLLAPLRTPDAARTAASDPPAARPSLGAIGHHRLAFGPRPGDVAAFDALPGDDTARLTEWVDAQLAPGGVDDSDIARRIAEANFSPDGYPDRHTAWTGVMSKFGRWNTAGALVQGRLKDENGTELTVDGLDLMPQALRTAGEIIDWWAERLYGRPAAAVTRAEAIAFLAGDQPADGRLRTGHPNDRLSATVQLLLPSPTDAPPRPTAPATLDVERGRI